MARIEEIRSAVEAVIRESNFGADIEGFKSFFDEQRDGTRIIVVELAHKYSTVPLSVRQTRSMAAAIQDKLFEIDEERYPIIRHKFATGQTIAGAA